MRSGFEAERVGAKKRGDRGILAVVALLAGRPLLLTRSHLGQGGTDIGRALDQEEFFLI